jgi:hypothetical protein
MFYVLHQQDRLDQDSFIAWIRIYVLHLQDRLDWDLPARIQCLVLRTRPSVLLAGGGGDWRFWPLAGFDLTTRKLRYQR